MIADHIIVNKKKKLPGSFNNENVTRTRIQSAVYIFLLDLANQECIDELYLLIGSSYDNKIKDMKISEILKIPVIDSK